MAADGARVLSEQSVAAMQRPHVAVPAPAGLGNHWGLGWHLDEWSGQAVIGHSGTTLGQQSFLRAFPGTGTAVALMTNGGGALEMFEKALAELAPRLAGVAPPPPQEPHVGAQPDAAHRLGRYDRSGQSFEVTQEGEELRLTIFSTTPDEVAREVPPYSAALRHVDGDVWAFRVPGMSFWVPVAFVDLPDGSSYLHMGGRATPKVRS